MGVNQHNIKNEKLVSIIMPAYNTREFIGETIDSVLKQTYSNWELIIVDDCSTDNTEEIVNKYKVKDSRIKLHKQATNQGAALARNKALSLSNGYFAAFLDSDDIWFPDKLKVQINFMEKHDYLFTCTSYNKIDENGLSLNRIIRSKKESDYTGVLKTCPGNSTVIYNIGRIGIIKIPDIKKRNDYVMWLKVIKKTDYLFGIHETLSSHRVRKEGISSKKIDLIKYHWNVYRRIEKLSIAKSIYLVIFWIIMTVFKIR